MSFPEEVKTLHLIRNEITKLSELLTPSVINDLRKAGNINLSGTDELITAVTTIQEASPNIKTVINGLSSIDNILKIQNQVQYVSDVRDSVGLVAGSIDEVKKVADYATTFGGVIAMKPMIDEVLALSTKMDKALDLEEKMDAILAVEARLDTKLDTIRDFSIAASNASTETKTALFEVTRKEKQIDKKLKEIRVLRKEFIDFNVNVDFVDYTKESSASYDDKTHTLILKVREGKQGIKGNPGSDGRVGMAGSVAHEGRQGLQGEPGTPGKELKIDAMGNTVERKRFGNRPIGTTFLALDGKIPMLYFRKSNTLDDWTDGIPFGSNPIKHADNATNAEKLMGMTLVQLKAYINK